MTPSLTHCNSYIIIYQFQLSKFKRGEIFMIPSLINAVQHHHLPVSIIKVKKKGIRKLSNCNNWLPPHVIHHLDTMSSSIH